MERSAGLASSAISSSDRIQRRISSQSGVSGSICAKSPERESLAAGSSSVAVRENDLARFAASSREQMRSSSRMPRDPPISRRFKDPVMLLMPEKESAPLLKILVSASRVCNCSRLICARSVIGRSARQRAFASSLCAYSASCAVIL